MGKVKDFAVVEKCRLCASANLDEVLDFGSVAIGNNLADNKEEALTAKAYPLKVNRCAECEHFQLSVAISPKILYQKNYSYLSSIGDSFRRHLKNYVSWLFDLGLVCEGSQVLDIGSNDGTALKYFAKRGCKVIGIDPASGPAAIANAAGIETYCDFFGTAAGERLKGTHGAFDFITSHNVLAHVESLTDTFATVHSLLKPEGYFCFEVGYFRSVVESGLFDTVYHEHLDYHHAIPLHSCLTRLGFEVISYSTNDAQGGTLRVLCRKKSSRKDLPPELDTHKVLEFLAEERNCELFTNCSLERWQEGIKSNLRDLRQLIDQLKKKGLSIVGYGAPTKCVLLMHLLAVDAESIPVVFEDNHLKVGKFLPQSGIPILSSSELWYSDANVVVVLAWNFYRDIKKKLVERLGRDIRIICPLPAVRVDAHVEPN